MRIFTILFLCFIVSFSTCCSRISERELKDVSEREIRTTKDGDIKYQRELEEIRKTLKGDIKIKLKKDPKGNYSWEIVGKDAQEILRANEILKKRLSD